MFWESVPKIFSMAVICVSAFDIRIFYSLVSFEAFWICFRFSDTQYANHQVSLVSQKPVAFLPFVEDFHESQFYFK